MLSSINAYDMDTISNHATYIDPKDLDNIYVKKMQQNKRLLPGHLYGSVGIGTSWNDYRLNKNNQTAYPEIPDKVDQNYHAGYQVNSWISVDFGLTKIHSYAFKKVNNTDNALTQFTHQGNQTVGKVTNSRFIHWAIRFDNHEMDYRPSIWAAIGFANASLNYTDSTDTVKNKGNTGYFAIGYDNPMNEMFGVTSSLSYTTAQKNMGANYLMSIGLYGRY